MDTSAATPRTELLTGDLVTIPSGKFPADEWRIAEISGPWLQLLRVYPRQGISNTIETQLPVLRVS